SGNGNLSAIRTMFELLQTAIIAQGLGAITAGKRLGEILEAYAINLPVEAKPADLPARCLDTISLAPHELQGLRRGAAWSWGVYGKCDDPDDLTSLKLARTQIVVDAVEGVTEVVGEGVGGGDDVGSGLDFDGLVAAGGLHELAD